MQEVIATAPNMSSSAYHNVGGPFIMKGQKAKYVKVKASLLSSFSKLMEGKDTLTLAMLNSSDV